MGFWKPYRSFICFVIALGRFVVAEGAEPFSALDLVSADAAFCLEVPHLESTWPELETGSFMERLRSVPIFQRLLESRGFQQWQAAENHVGKLTGQTISAQLRALLAKSLVIAVYVPANGKPQGILIGEANNADAIEKVISTWNKLEPNQVTSTRSYRGERYQQRKKHAGGEESAFILTSGRWFAITDQETLIQDVVDRMAHLSDSTSKNLHVGSLSHSNLFVRNRKRLRTDGSGYVYLAARPWDRGLEEAVRDPRDPINPAEIWRHISVVSASIQLDRGIVCDAVVELDTAHLPRDWSNFVATATSTSNLARRIPAEAILGISGHLDLAPLVHFVVNQFETNDRAEFTKNRRIAQSVMNGHDLFDRVLPELAKDFSGSILTRTDRQTNRASIDGNLTFTTGSQTDAELLRDVAQGLESSLVLVAGYFSSQGPNVVTVQREQTETSILRWLSKSALFPIAFGLKGQSLVVAGSEDHLRRSLDSLDNTIANPRLSDHSKRYFPLANQLIWIDTALARRVLEQNGADLARLLSHDSAEETSRLANRFEQSRPILGLVDSLFIAGRFESDHIRITFGGGID